MASQEFIRQVAAANDIVEVIQSYFPLERAGSNFKALSPFTQEKTPSFYVSPGKQAFYCFSSQQGGDVFKFVQLYENISFPEALKKLAERAGLEEEGGLSPEMAATYRRRSQLRDLHRQAREYFHQLLTKSPAAAPARDYLQSRGIGIETARHWKLGYAPEQSREIFQWARQAGFRESQLLDGGLARRSDRTGGVYAHFRHRLLFPVANDYGETIAFSGRVLSPDQQGGKYINSPETEIFQKSRTFFGFDRSKQAILKRGFAILCEGQLDLITAFESGVENIVAPLGTAFTEGHARLLRRHTEEVVLCFDADRAGLKAAEKSFAELARAGVMVRVALLPAGEDPDSLIRSQGPEAFADIVDQAPDYFDAQISRRLSNPGQATIKERIQLAESLAAQVALIEDPMKRGLVVEQVASRLGIPPEQLQRICEQTGRRNRSLHHRRTTDRTRETAATGPRLDLFPKTHVVQVLCRLLLTSREAREWLQEHGDRSLLRDMADTELLDHLWGGELDPEDPSSRPAFLGRLPEAAQNAAMRLLLESGPSPDLDLAKDCYLALVRRSLQNRCNERKARLRSPPTSEAQLLDLLREIADLESQLRDLPPPRGRESDL